MTILPYVLFLQRLKMCAYWEHYHYYYYHHDCNDKCKNIYIAKTLHHLTNFYTKPSIGKVLLVFLNA